MSQFNNLFWRFLNINANRKTDKHCFVIGFDRQHRVGYIDGEAPCTSVNNIQTHQYVRRWYRRRPSDTWRCYEKWFLLPTLGSNVLYVVHVVRSALKCLRYGENTAAHQKLQLGLLADCVAHNFIDKITWHVYGHAAGRTDFQQSKAKRLRHLGNCILKVYVVLRAPLAGLTISVACAYEQI